MAAPLPRHEAGEDLWRTARHLPSLKGDDGPGLHRPAAERRRRCPSIRSEKGEDALAPSTGDGGRPTGPPRTLVDQ